MGKYDALGAFLRRWARRNTANEVELNFAQMEAIINGLLPKAALQGDWWDNQPQSGRGHVQCNSWLDAGFEATLIPGQERVQFRR